MTDDYDAKMALRRFRAIIGAPLDRMQQKWAEELFVIIDRYGLPEVKVEPNGDLHVGGWTLSVDEPTTWDDVLAMVAAYEWAQKNPPVDEDQVEKIADILARDKDSPTLPFDRMQARRMYQLGLRAVS